MLIALSDKNKEIVKNIVVMIYLFTKIHKNNHFHIIQNTTLYLILARSPRRSTGDKSGLCNSILCLCVYLFVDVFWAKFLISGRRHVILGRVTIEVAAG